MIKLNPFAKPEEITSGNGPWETDTTFFMECAGVAIDKTTYHNGKHYEEQRINLSPDEVEKLQVFLGRAIRLE